MLIPKTSAEARDILTALHSKSGVRPNLWARAAIGYSLSLEELPDERHYDSDGSELPPRVLLGTDDEVILALLRQRHGAVIEGGDTGKLLKLHWERGLRFFSSEFARLNRRGDELILSLLAMSTDGVSEATKVDESPVPAGGSFQKTLEIGANLRTGVLVHHSLNGPGLAPHVALMGKNGTGKTRTGLKLLESLWTSAPYRVPFLIFDYAKGDIASNSAFCSATSARVIKLPDVPIPLAPLALPRRDRISVQIAARRFRDTISSVVRLGPVQGDRCVGIIEQLFSVSGLVGQESNRTPDLSDLLAVALQDYQANGWKEDSLISCLREFGSFPLFRTAQESDKHQFFEVPHIIDVHRLPEVLRKLAVFLTMDRLYSEIMELPDAPLDSEGNRKLKLVVAIDEAHHYLPCKQQTLEAMVREVRSKGVGVWLFSQSPDDFDQSRYNFSREMGLSIVFSCVLERPKMLEAVLGGRVEPRRLSQLPTGVALCRPSGSDAALEVQAWQP